MTRSARDKQGSAKDASSDLRWRGTSAEDRVDDRKRRLIEATLTLVGSEGEAALSVRAVCRLAKVGPRHFYEVFPDTNALLIATYDHAVALLTEAITSAIAASEPRAPWATRTLRSRLHQVFSAAAIHLESHPSSARVTFQAAQANDVLRAHGNASLTTFVDRVRVLVLVAPHPQHAALETAMLSGGLSAVFTSWLAGELPEAAEDVAEYCTEVSLAILTAGGERAPKRPT